MSTVEPQPAPRPDAIGSRAGTWAVVARLRPEVARFPPLTRGRVQGISWLNVVMGSVLLLLVAALLVVIAVRGLPTGANWFQIGFGGVFTSSVGALMLWNGLRVRRVLRGAPRDRRTALPLPDHAFAVDGDRVEFPAGPGAPAESWSLAETSCAAVRRLGVTMLRLSAAGRRTRTYAQRVLADPVADLVQRIEAARAAGR